VGIGGTEARGYDREVADVSTVAEAYNRDPEREWQRLVRDPYHSLEFLVTLHHLREYLPPTGRVLDAGGGPGRYAIELCRAGYEVVLLDISSELIATAQEKFQSEPEAVQKRLLEFVVGDIRDLSQFEADHFDAVLCLGGPLTHISVEADRLRAVSELVRVAKPGAIVSIAVIGYLAVLRTILVRFSDDLLAPSFEELVAQGDTIGTTGTPWHFFRADELRQLAESCGLKTVGIAGCEGLSTGLVEATNLLGQDKAKWKRWTDLILKTSAEPAVVDMAEHILYIGRA
jgi:ubiquinone/menaquinone biosynthesis C-methylase UbiE